MEENIQHGMQQDVNYGIQRDVELDREQNMEESNEEYSEENMKMHMEEHMEDGAGDDSTRQDSIEILKDINAKYPQKPFTTQDVVLDIIMLFVTTAIAFGWMLLMLLIISFVTLSYLHIEIGTMLIISTVFAAISFVGYIIKKTVKYKKLLNQ